MYERPEILEVGQAAELTLGFRDRDIVDGCDCTKYDDGSKGGIVAA